MARRITRKRSRRTRRRNSKKGAATLRWWQHWRRWVAGVVVVGLAYVVYLDVVIRIKFEGKRWALPAHVYARPLELYEGAPVNQHELQLELNQIGYRPAYRVTEPGTYRRKPDGFEVRTRGFHFWDGVEASQTVKISFADDTVAAIRNTGSTEAINLLRLDPMFIGGIYPDKHEDRLLVRLDETPDVLKQALIAVEDRNFYSHHGLDFKAIGRALWANLRAGATVQGGSTLTQQLVKNFFLSNTRSLWRKANEAVMAVLLELHYDKDEILEAYLNEVYLGQQGKRAVHGFGLASRFYFDKPLAQLDLSRVTTLVALVRGPTYYDPRRHADRLQERRGLVLDVLVEQGVINAAAARQAKAADLHVIPDPPQGISPYPGFMDLVLRQLQRDYREEDLTSEGLRIFTTLDPVVQYHTEQALQKRARRLDRDQNLSGHLDGAALVTATTGGEVLALVAGRKTRFAGFNRALDAKRPVGSLMKPVVYLTALQSPERYNLASLVDDSPVTVTAEDGEAWTPANYDRESHGSVPLFVALTRSFNQATVRLGLDLGITKVGQTLRDLGLEREVSPYPSMLLGATAMTPYEITQIYQTMAAGGFRSPLSAIREVLTSEGEPLQRYSLNVQQAVDPATNYVLTSALREVMRHGTGRSAVQWLANAGEFAGKTGTTNDLRDSWFAGFGANRLGVVWLGSDDNRPIGLTGASGALAVWSDIMKRTRARALPATTEQDVDVALIDPETGFRAPVGCDVAAELAFLKGTLPEQKGACSGETDSGKVRWFKKWFRR